MKVSKVLIAIFLVVIVIGGGTLAYLKFWQKTAEKEVASEKALELVERDNLILPTYSIKEGAFGLYPESYPDFYTNNFNTHLFETLVYLDPENKIAKLLAENWTNPDDNTWRFNLNPNAKFSNGSPLTAEDVKFTFDYLMESNSPSKDFIPSVKEIGIINATTVDFITSDPDPILLNRLAINFFILSKEEVEKNGTKNNIGSGTYLIQEKTDLELKLVRNENYWGEKPKIKQFSYVVSSPDESVNFDLLLNNKLDMLSYGYGDQASQDKIAAAIANKEVSKIEFEDPSVYFLGFDSVSGKTPYIDQPENPLRDLKVRQAIAMAIDLDEVLASSDKLGLSNQIVNKGIFGYNENISSLPHDPIKAKELMAEAGYSNGFSMTIDGSVSSLKEVKDVYSAITAGLQQIGINATINELSQEQLMQKVMKKDLSAYLISWSPDTMESGDVLNALLHTPTDDHLYGASNLGYSNTSLDQVLDQASRNLDPKSRLTQLKQAIKIASDDVAMLPLHHFNTKRVFSKDLHYIPRMDGGIRVFEIAGLKK